MIHLYPFTKKAALLTLTIGFLCSSMSFAQVSPCGPIVENFNNTGGSMAGFESATQASAAPGFHYAMSGQDGYLERCNVPGFDSLYEIISPTYQTLASQTSIGVGFELSGVVNIAQVHIFIQYTNNTGGISTAWTTSLVPTYSGNVATICTVIPLTALPGYTAGSPYRVHIFLRPAASSNNNQCIVFDDFRSTGAPSQIILPVYFSSFVGRVAGSTVQLRWDVAGETEVSHYEVERSTNGRDFTKIGAVDANGGTTYTYTDLTPGSGVVFYRVRNVDMDGQFKYTAVIRVNLSKSIRLTAYPQPFHNVLTIEHGVTNNGRISITSASGQVVKMVTVNGDMNQTSINTSDLKAGMYVVRFDDGRGNVETLKAIRQ